MPGQRANEMCTVFHDQALRNNQEEIATSWSARRLYQRIRTVLTSLKGGGRPTEVVWLDQERR